MDSRLAKYLKFLTLLLLNLLHWNLRNALMNSPFIETRFELVFFIFRRIGIGIFSVRTTFVCILNIIGGIFARLTHQRNPAHCLRVCTFCFFL